MKRKTWLLAFAGGAVAYAVKAYYGFEGVTYLLLAYIFYAVATYEDQTSGLISKIQELEYEKESLQDDLAALQDELDACEAQQGT